MPDEKLLESEIQWALEAINKSVCASPSVSQECSVEYYETLAVLLQTNADVIKGEMAKAT